MTMCRFPELARFLGSQGISSLRFDHAMAIQSESERQGPFKIGNHDDEVDDAHVAVGELAMRGFRVVCLLGHSKGGFNALFYAATHRDVPSVVCLSGRFRVRVGLMQRVRACEKGGTRGVQRGDYEGLVELLIRSPFAPALRPRSFCSMARTFSSAWPRRSASSRKSSRARSGCSLKRCG